MNSLHFSSPMRPEPSGSLHRQTILIVDTNYDFVRSARETLVQKGYTVLSASTPEEATFAVGKKPDLILCDMALAIHANFSILKQMRYRLAPKRVSIVLMSRHGTLHDIRYALKIGADDCFAKAVSEEMFGTLVDARFQRFS